MALKILNSTFVSRRWISLDSEGVEYGESAVGSTKRRFKFHEIDAVLLSAMGLFAFQVGSEVFSVETKKQDKKHQELMDNLVKAVRASAR